ncbi:hypothetical protein OG462_16200 [Streptomyces sp. NBC_01077]|uniref:hypothetical protein n=1 Tax=Streptomyces sp. NBC_01077 TaxID=2903746 RepID=UPI0038679F9C|nr:hypothetical protein OG462_16200 [Streptomyces sp. NBC_01077]
MSRTTLSERGDVRMSDDDGENIDAARGLRQALPWVALVIAMGAGALLSVGAFLGVYLRPTSDDWCALWKTRDMGVLGITADFYRTQNGRVTNAFLTGLLYTDDMRGPKLLPAFLVVTLGAGLFLLARAALRALRLPFPATAAAAAVLVLEALLFFAGTRSYQVLLWAPSTISHTLPSVLGVWAVLSGVWGARSRRRWARGTAVGAAALLGTAAGMLSEPFVAMSGLIAAATGVLCLPRFGRTRDRFASTWCAAWCLGLLIGLVMLTTSPGARWRRAQQPKEPLSLSGVGETFHDWWRIWETIGGQWAYAGALGAGVLLGLAVALSDRRDRRGEDARAGRTSSGGTFQVAVVLLPLPLIVLGSLVAAYGLRSGYGASGWTYARTWTSFLVPFLLALSGYGAWFGYRLGRGLRDGHATSSEGDGPGGRPAPGDGHRLGGSPSPAGVRAARLAALVVTGAVAVASLAALVPAVRALTEETVVRSVAWDRQDARIRAEVAAGRREVTYRPLYIGALAEPFFTEVYEKDWAARCTASYYRVDRLVRP